LWVIGGEWKKVPFDDQRRHSFKMAAAATILDLVPINYLMNALLGVTGGRFLSMISAAAYSRWQGFPSII
jgi:hypothetical protein